MTGAAQERSDAMVWNKVGSSDATTVSYNCTGFFGDSQKCRACGVELKGEVGAGDITAFDSVVLKRGEGGAVGEGDQCEDGGENATVLRVGDRSEDIVRVDIHNRFTYG